MNKKPLEKLFNSLQYSIVKITSMAKIIVVILMANFINFSIGIEEYWTSFHFWFGVIYIAFIYIWMDKMQSIISEPIKCTKQIS